MPNSLKCEINGQSSPGGFALVIALALMSFVLLLLLSLTAFVRVETRNADMHLQRLKAEQNSLLGLQVALGELQKTLGPDAQTSFTASIFDASPDTLSVDPQDPSGDGVRNPLWVGSIPTRASAQGSGTPLESFNESTRSAVLGYDTATNLAGDAVPSGNQLQWLVSMPGEGLDRSAANYDPSVALSSDASAIAGGQSNVLPLLQYKENGILVEEAVAGKIEVSDSEGDAPGTYAWWVGDEGVKARINHRREPPTVPDVDAGAVNYQASQVNSLEWLGGGSFSDLRPDDPGAAVGSLEKLYSHQALPLLPVSAGATDALLANQPQFSYHSSALPVDVVEGRLKKDLTAYLVGGQAGFLDRTRIFPNDSDDFYGEDSGPSYPLDFGDDRLASFGLIKSWYEIGQNLRGFATGSASAQAHDPAAGQHGIAPVIQRFGLWIQPLFDADPTGGPAEVLYKIMPMVVLWNPHNVPLKANSYVMQFNAPPVLGLLYQCGLGNGATVQRGKIGAIDLSAYGTSEKNAIPPDQNPIDTGSGNPNGLVYRLNAKLNMRSLLDENNDDDNAGLPSNLTYRWLTFAVNDLSLKPGETRLLTADLSTASTWGPGNSLADYQNNDVGSLNGPPGSGNANMLTNDNNDLSGFVIRSGTFLSREDDSARGPRAQDILKARLTFFSFRQLAYSYKLHAWNGSRFDEVFYMDNRYVARPIGHQSPSAIAEWMFNDWWMWPLNVYEVDSHLNHITFSEIRNSRHTTMCATIINTADYGSAWERLAHSKFDFNLRSPQNYLPFVYRDQYGDFSVRSPKLSEYPIGHNMDNRLGTSSQLNQQNDGSLKIFNNSGYDSASIRPTTSGLRTQYRNSGDGSDAILVSSLYDYQREEEPLLSLGRLQHVQLGARYWDVPHAFGNSIPHRMIERDQLSGHAYALPAEDNNGRSLNELNDFSDLSYLSNSALWDRFFLSSLPYDGSALGPSTVLPNQRHQLHDDFTLGAPDAGYLEQADNGFDTAARFVRVDGALNINSTNKEAWRSLLAGALGQDVEAGGAYDLSGDSHDGSTTVSFPRMSRPATPEAADHPLYSESDPTKKAGYLAANTAHNAAAIDRLAEAIVEEVKRRGPFLSLADFVNRRLIPDANNTEGDYLGLNGTLQAAINKVTQEAKSQNESWLNGRYFQGFEDDKGLFQANELDLWKPSLREHYTGLPEAEETTIYQGAPAWLTQADLLSAIGPALSARSDTFTIRSLGQSVDPVTGEVEAEVILEAVVQRVIEPVDPADALDPARVIQPTGRFGRRFEIVGLKKLDDIVVEIH